MGDLIPPPQNSIACYSVICAYTDKKKKISLHIKMMNVTPTFIVNLK